MEELKKSHYQGFLSQQENARLITKMSLEEIEASILRLQNKIASMPDDNQVVAEHKKNFFKKKK